MIAFQKKKFGLCAIIACLTLNGPAAREQATVPAMSPGDVLKGCGCAIQVPPAYRVVAREDRLLVAQTWAVVSGKRIPVSLRFFCVPNPRRTSMISEVQDAAAEKNMNVRRFVTLEIENDLPAALYVKSRIFEGRVIQNVEGYFATRSDEYFLHIIPETSGAPVPAGLETALLEDARSALDSLVFFASIQPAISEANYRLRFYGLLAALGTLSAAGVLLLARRFARRRAAKRAGTAEVQNPASNQEH